MRARQSEATAACSSGDILREGQPRTECGRAGARPYRISDEQELIPTEKPSAREQSQVIVPMPEHESYPHDHKGSDTVTDEKRERHCGAGEAAAG